MTHPPKRILIIGGAGAIASTLAHHLLSTGSFVSLLVRPERINELASAGGVDLQCISLFDAWRALSNAPVLRCQWAPGAVLTEEQAAAAAPYDVVFVTPSVAALLSTSRGCELLRRLGTGSCRDASFVIIRVGLRDSARVASAAGVPSSHIVESMMTTIAWTAPLRGEAFSRLAPALRRPAPPGQLPPVAYILPAPIPVSGTGTEGRAAAVARLLSGAGVPAQVAASLDAAAVVGALILPLHLLLELHVWSFRAVRRSGRVHEAVAAGREAVAVLAHEAGSPWLRLWGAAVAWALAWSLLALAPLIAPFDVEAFFRAHFGGKMAAQTLLLAEEAVSAGSAARLPTPRLGALLDEVRARAPQPPPPSSAPPPPSDG